MLSLSVHTPDGLLFQGQVMTVTLPGTAGPFTVLDHHAPIISSLEAGKVVYTDANGINEIACGGGFARVEKNMITVCIE